MPMAVSAVAASHLVPSFPARSRRRRAAPRAAAGGLTARARRLRCEFVAGGGNGALSGEDDPRLVDRVRISPRTSQSLPLLLVLCWCHFVERVRRSRGNGSVSYSRRRMRSKTQSAARRCGTVRARCLLRWSIVNVQCSYPLSCHCIASSTRCAKWHCSSRSELLLLPL